MTAARATGGSYARSVPDSPFEWPGAGRLLLEELIAGRGRCALIAGHPAQTDALTNRLVDDLGLHVVHLGPALADRPTAPAANEIDEAVGDATVLADLDLLLWPDLGVTILPFLTARARRRPTIAVWPGEITAGRARSSLPGRPDHHDECLDDLVVLRPRTTAFPDEVPYEIERIAQ